jgi:hypothetical protein
MLGHLWLKLAGPLELGLAAQIVEQGTVLSYGGQGGWAAAPARFRRAVGAVRWGSGLGMKLIWEEPLGGGGLSSLIDAIAE